MRKFELAIVYTLLMLGTGVGQSFVNIDSTAATAESQPAVQMLFGVLYLFLFLFLLKKLRRRALLLLARERWSSMIVLLAFASIAWSTDPVETFRRAVALAGTTMVGLFLGLRFDVEEQLDMLAMGIGLGALLSLAVVLLFPTVGIMPDGTGAWQGVYHLKNSLGRMMALGALAFLLLAIGRRRRPQHWLMFLLCVGLLLLSKSATAVVVFLLIFVWLPLRKFLAVPARYLIGASVPLLIIIPATLFWVTDNSNVLLGALGRNAALTGRIPLWQLVIKDIAARPILGYGYSAFWSSTESDRIKESLVWELTVPHSHNGFLETCLGLGIIGLVLLFLSLFKSSALAARAANIRENPTSLWPIVIVAFTVLYNLTESSLLSVNSTLWMIYVANSFYLTRTQQHSHHLQDAAKRHVSHSALPAWIQG